MANPSGAKGRRGEHSAAAALQEHLGLRAERTGQMRQSGKERVGDLVAPGVAIHFEVKHGKRPPIGPAMEQALAQCASENIPVALTKQDRKPWLVTLRLEDLPRLAEEVRKVSRGEQHRRPPR